MPKPIICLSDTLRQFAEAFRDLFTKPQWKYFVTVLLGLVECQERRTLSGLLRCVAAQVSLAGLSRFLSQAPWSEQAVAERWQTRFRQRLLPLVQAEHDRQQAEREPRVGRPKATLVTGYLILDDSPHVKVKGRKMQGLGQHHSTIEKRRVTGHSLFTGLYVVLGQCCPLAPQMYRQQVTCQAEGVSFQSKVEMAEETVATCQPVPNTETHVLVDSWYFCQRVHKAAQKRGWEMSGGVKSNRTMRRIAPDGTRHWLKLSDYAASLSDADFEPVVWPSAQGGRTIYAHRVTTWVRKFGPVQLLVTRETLEAPRTQWRYWATTLMEVDAQAIVDILAIRWDIETLFEDSKDLLGADHYQVMTAQAIVRFWTLVACIAAFLDEQRAAPREATLQPYLTRGEVRMTLQTQHQLNLLTWIDEQLRNGLSPKQVQTCLVNPLS